MASTSTNTTIYIIMATKTGIINNEDKHNELSRASLLVLEKQKGITKMRKKKKVYTIPTSKGIIETTDPEKWIEYNNRKSV